MNQCKKTGNQRGCCLHHSPEWPIQLEDVVLADGTVTASTRLYYGSCTRTEHTHGADQIIFLAKAAASLLQEGEWLASLSRITWRGLGHNMDIKVTSSPHNLDAKRMLEGTFLTSHGRKLYFSATPSPVPVDQFQGSNPIMARALPVDYRLRLGTDPIKLQFSPGDLSFLKKSPHVSFGVFADILRISAATLLQKEHPSSHGKMIRIIESLSIPQQGDSVTFGMRMAGTKAYHLNRSVAWFEFHFNGAPGIFTGVFTA